MNEKWLLEEFNSSFVHNLQQEAPVAKKAKKKTDSKLLLMWPTVDHVRNSILGYQGTGHYCLYQKNLKKHMHNLLHQFQPVPPYRRKLLSHAKLYTRFASIKHEEDPTVSSSNMGNLLAYVLMTSCNLSKAAWGMLCKGPTLMIRSYELGVLFLPRYEASTGVWEQLYMSSVPLIKDGNEGKCIGFPIPMQLDAPAYQEDDEPFISDMSSDKLDNYGFRMREGRLESVGTTTID